MVEVKVKKLVEYAVIPSYAHEGDAGMDFCSAEDYLVKAGKRETISTGISMEIPVGYVSLVWDKSGLASKKGVTVLGGVIDSHYRGEYKVVLYNTSEMDLEIKRGDKIAQILIQPVERASLSLVDELSETSRGRGGFGSSGGTSALERL